MKGSGKDIGYVVTAQGLYAVRKSTYQPRSLVDAICDSWTPPGELDLTEPVPTGLKGQMSDLLRMKDSVDSAIEKSGMRG